MAFSDPLWTPSIGALIFDTGYPTRLAALWPT